MIDRWFRDGADMASLRLPLIVVGTLVGLMILGAGTAAVVSAKRTPAAGTAASAGPKKTYAALPEMSFALGDAAGRSLDLKVLVELSPQVDPRSTELYVPRIADRLGDRIREIGTDRLGGAEGALLVKNMLSSVVGRELRPLGAGEVLLERMIVR